jgi:hypothetical protein
MHGTINIKTWSGWWPRKADKWNCGGLIRKCRMWPVDNTWNNNHTFCCIPGIWRLGSLIYRADCLVGSVRTLKKWFSSPLMKLKQLSIFSVFSFGCFPGVWFILADVSEHSICSIFKADDLEVGPTSSRPPNYTDYPKYTKKGSPSDPLSTTFAHQHTI